MSHNLNPDVQRLGPWFHNIRLPDGSTTAPHHPFGDFPRYKWDALAPHLPADLHGWTALDVGCNAGFYSFELARRGARVTGIDLDARYLEQARWAARQLSLEHRVTFLRRQVYDLARMAEGYDLVLFLGVFYHLRYPLLGLDCVRRVTRRLLAFQSLRLPGETVVENTDGKWVHQQGVMADEGWPRLAFVEHVFAGDPTNWFIPNRAGMEALLRSAGFHRLHRVDPETYLAEPLEGAACAEGWNAAEFLAATGQAWHGREGDRLRPAVGTVERLRPA
jgi:tRNA (mo5U34)-methyltransferase